MVNLTRIYTRTGDAGETRLGDMSQTTKLDSRLAAYADVDEANACIGVALAAGRLDQDYVDRLEGWCDQYNEDLPKLRSFILNGGSVGAAHLHVARTVVRRAERAGWAAWSEHEQTMNILAIKYLNRLSDLLFILARHANRAIGDVLWQPGGQR